MRSLESGIKDSKALTGIQLSTSGAKFVPLIFYHLHSITQDILKLQKVKNYETI
jgi:hypothetical protein